MPGGGYAGKICLSDFVLDHFTELSPLEYCVIHKDMATPIPESWDFVQATAIPEVSKHTWFIGGGVSRIRFRSG